MLAAILSSASHRSAKNTTRALQLSNSQRLLNNWNLDSYTNRLEKTGLLLYAASAMHFTHQLVSLCLQWRSSPPYTGLLKVSFIVRKRWLGLFGHIARLSHTVRLNAMRHWWWWWVTVIYYAEIILEQKFKNCKKISIYGEVKSKIKEVASIFLECGVRRAE